MTSEDRFLSRMSKSLLNSFEWYCLTSSYDNPAEITVQSFDLKSEDNCYRYEHDVGFLPNGMQSGKFQMADPG